MRLAGLDPPFRTKPSETTGMCLVIAQETKTGTKVDWLTSAYYSLGQTEYGLRNFPAAKSAFEKFIGRNPGAGAQLTEARRLLNGELK